MKKTIGLLLGAIVVVLALAVMILNKETGALLKVKKLETAPTIDASWDKAPWQGIQPELIGNFMGEKPQHLPKTEVKIAYDDTALYLIFRVEDQYVRAVAADHQRGVYRDSCVEFFFTTGTDVAQGYFNLEMNCGGRMLFSFQRAPEEGQVSIPKAEIGKIEIAHSLPQIIDPEIEEPTTWTVEYRLPLSVLDSYCPVAKPAPGVTWRANFQKCADAVSHPHWLTWAVIDSPRPNFHLPQFFGTLEFE